MTTEAEKKNTDCVFFLSGTCRNGDGCEFRHSEKAKINPVTCAFWLKHQCTRTDCVFRHPSRPPDARKKPCIFFLQGNCTKGDACPFLHPGAASALSNIIIDDTEAVHTKPPLVAGSLPAPRTANKHTDEHQPPAATSQRQETARKQPQPNDVPNTRSEAGLRAARAGATAAAAQLNGIQPRSKRLAGRLGVANSNDLKSDLSNGQPGRSSSPAQQQAPAGIKRPGGPRAFQHAVVAAVEDKVDGPPAVIAERVQAVLENKKPAAPAGTRVKSNPQIEASMQSSPFKAPRPLAEILAEKRAVRGASPAAAAVLAPPTQADNITQRGKAQPLAAAASKLKAPEAALATPPGLTPPRQRIDPAGSNGQASKKDAAAQGPKQADKGKEAPSQAPSTASPAKSGPAVSSQFIAPKSFAEIMEEKRKRRQQEEEEQPSTSGKFDAASKRPRLQRPSAAANSHPAQPNATVTNDQLSAPPAGTAPAAPPHPPQAAAAEEEGELPDAADGDANDEEVIALPEDDPDFIEDDEDFEKSLREYEQQFEDDES